MGSQGCGPVFYTLIRVKVYVFEVKIQILNFFKPSFDILFNQKVYICIVIDEQINNNDYDKRRNHTGSRKDI